jgi:lipopolysaccharide export system permease protein
MWGRLDRYVGKNVLASFAATLLFVVLLFVVIDLLLQMTKYLRIAQESERGLMAVLGYWAWLHLISLPWIFVLLAPFVTVIGCMFAISRLMGTNEITPMVFIGRSTARILRPCLLMGCASAAAMAGMWQFVLPATSRTMTELQQRLSKDGDGTGVHHVNLICRGDRGARLMADRYDPDGQRLEGVVVVDFGSGQSEGDLSELNAAAATWDEAALDWRLEGGMLKSGQHSEPRQWLGLPSVTPRIVWLSGRDDEASAALSYSEVVELMELSPERPDLVVALHFHLTWPLANLVLLMLSLPFAVHFERGSKIGRVMFAIMICGAYLLVDLTCQNLGRREFLHPVLAAWTPSIVFGSLGAVMFGGMRT